METRKHRFNIIDVLALILIAGAIVLLVLHLTGGTGRDEHVKLTFVMETLRDTPDGTVPEGLAANVAPGDAVYDAETGRRIGTVTDCGSRLEISGYEKHYTLSITCEADCVRTSSYESNGVVISVGRRYTLMLPNLYCRAECIFAEPAAAGEN